MLMPLAATDAKAEFDIDAWLNEHWDPEVTVAEWWSRLAEARLSHPMFPEPWGRGWSRRWPAGW